MVIEGKITITNINGKIDIYNNTILRGNVKYILKKGSKTKKFPTFTIEYDSKGFVEGDLHIVVCISHLKFISEDLFAWGIERMKLWKEINVNEIEHTERNELPVYIFTNEDCD